MTEYGRYRIELNKNWSLEDLYFFPRTFEQVYFFFLSIDKEHSDTDKERIERAYNSFPWQGGYSAVSFFNQIRFATPRQGRPKIIAIQKQSPGFLDLGLITGVAISIAIIVKNLASAIDIANTTYNNIYKGAQERKLLKLSVDRATFQFEREQITFIANSNKQLAQMMGLKSASDLNKLTGNPYLTLKILLSIYRRVRILCKYENSGKAHLSENSQPPLPKLPPKKPRKK